VDILLKTSTMKLHKKIIGPRKKPNQEWISPNNCKHVEERKGIKKKQNTRNKTSEDKRETDTTV
jgi:hypothetical protein